MLKINKLLNILIIITIIFGISYLIYMYMLPYIYNLDNKKYVKCNNEQVFEASNNIIAKKLEIILYHDKENLFDLYAYNNKDKVKDYIKSAKYEELRKKYQGYQIKSINKYNKNIYLIEYAIDYPDEQLNEKMIVKIYKDFAIIFHDSLI